MKENETVLEVEQQPALEPEVQQDVQPEVQPEESKPSKFKNFLAGVKEWFRKFIVNLKRRPMNIAFFFLIVSSIIYLLSLGAISQAGKEYDPTGVPISLFINTLFCILVLLLFMYTFPKRSKKPKIVYFVLTFVFMAVMIALDILLYVQWTKAWDSARQLLLETNKLDQLAVREKYIYSAINGVLAHAVFVLFAGVLTATYPLYGKLINKINTKKVVESTEIKEAIDTEEEV